MRIIDIPATVTLKLRNPKGEAVEKVYPFTDFLKDAIDSCQSFGQGFAGMRRGLKLYNLVDAHANGDPLRVEDAEFDALKTAVETCAYHPAVGRQCTTYVDALENSQQVDTPGKK